MKATSIERFKVSAERDHDQEVKDSRIELAKAASTTLGYHRLENVIVNSATLIFALGKLGIDPLNEHQVAAYQASKAKKGMLSGTWHGISALTGLILWVIASSYVIARFPNNLSPLDVMKLTTAIVGGISLLILNISCTAAETWGWNAGTRKSFEWNTATIQSYKGNVPEHALTKAVEIKREVPEVTFNVEYLVEKSERVVRPAPDPFLVVSLGPERYYIDVWDEKEYERHL